jgi:hypothetical protein
MPRFGMLNLIVRLRRMVDDKYSQVWQDDELEEILDQHRIDFYADSLTAVARNVAGATVYTLYKSPYGNLEEYTDDDESVFRLFNSVGTSIAPTSNYTPNYAGGIFTFLTDQRGASLYLDARSYDLNGAAAVCWREAMGSKAKLYDFDSAGSKFSRAQWFEHCQEMAEMYSRLKRRVGSRVLRA